MLDVRRAQCTAPEPTIRVLRADVHVVQPDAAQPQQPPHQHQVLVVQHARSQRQRTKGIPCMPCSAATATTTAAGTASCCGAPPSHVVHRGRSARLRRRRPRGDLPRPPPPALRLVMRRLPLMRAVTVASVVVVLGVGVVVVEPVAAGAPAAVAPATVAPAAAARTPSSWMGFALPVGLPVLPVRIHVHLNPVLPTGIHIHAIGSAVAAFLVRGAIHGYGAKGSTVHCSGAVGLVACPHAISPPRPCMTE